MSAEAEKKLARKIQQELGCPYTAGLMAVRKFVRIRIEGGKQRTIALQEAREAVLQKNPQLMDLARNTVMS